jgi:threonine/homoserine/homoserine lactone efflux protein
VLLDLATFTLAAVLIVLLPGPDTLVVVRGVVRGNRTALLTVAGVLCGLMVWVSAASLGLAALLQASEIGFVALKIAGGCYLLWLGAQSLRTVLRRTSEQDDQAAVRRRRGLLGSGFVAGLLTDLLNPKVGVFFVTFLPGFVPHGYSVGWFSLLLGAIFVALTATYFAVLLVVSGRITTWMQVPRIRARMDALTGVVLIGFGIRLAVES